MLSELKKNLRKVASKEKARALARFFKTGKGQYGEGDVFLGVMVPQSRIIAKKYAELAFSDIKALLYSKIHEERLVALFILIEQYKKGGDVVRKKIYTFYIDNLKQVNNWDLIDLSAPNILGQYLFAQNVMTRREAQAILAKLSRSKNLWERRSAVLATFSAIKASEFAPSLDIAQKLIADDHDLIHKAVGWMLREVGKRDLATLENFLREENHYRTMPRTMLRYAIERMPEKKRKKYLSGR